MGDYPLGFLHKKIAYARSSQNRHTQLQSGGNTVYSTRVLPGTGTG